MELLVYPDIVDTSTAGFLDLWLRQPFRPLVDEEFGCERCYGGFEGLLYSDIERRYPALPGLNLTWEVREALAFKCRQQDATERQEYAAASPPTLEAPIRHSPERRPDPR